MSITVNGKTYASEEVKKAITEGNNQYYKDPNGNALNKTEMNRSCCLCKRKGIHIIPVINTPGHMDSILVAMEELGMSNPRYITMEKNQNVQLISKVKKLLISLKS